MRSSFYRLRGVIRKSLWRTEKEEKSSQRGDERSQGSCSQDVNKNIAYVIWIFLEFWWWPIREPDVEQKIVYLDLIWRSASIPV